MNYYREQKEQQRQRIGAALLVLASVMAVLMLAFWIAGIFLGDMRWGGAGVVIGLGALISLLVGGFGFRDWK